MPLTDRGVAAAGIIGERLSGLPFARVLSSPRSRALETARIAGFGNRVEVIDDLAEWDYGADEGRTTRQIRRERPGWTVWLDGPHAGEAIAAVAVRADRVVVLARAEPGDTLCFAHGHILRVVAARWLGLAPGHGRHFALATSTVSILGWERETAVIERWNEACPGGESTA